MKPQVLSKRDFAPRYMAGEFGNHSPSWNTVEAFLAYGMTFPRNERVPGKYHVRNRVAGGATHYNLNWSTAVARWLEQEKAEQWYCSQMVPKEVEDTLLLQGEVMQSPNGLALYYSTALGPMRTSLAKGGTQVYGVEALMRLQNALDCNSYNWLTVLLDEYPFHVIEFSAFCRCWGTLPNHNTLFWECRLY